MVVVRKNKGESQEAMWRKFGKIMFEESLVEELRARKFHRKPSLIKKEEEKERLKRRGRFRRRLRVHE